MWAYVKSNNADLVAKIEDGGNYNDDIAAEMKSALDAFKANGVW
jgi:F-type H+-transporting ATPase subunit alpha